MDLIGINSRHLRREIDANNTVAVRLGGQLRRLNGFATAFLAKQTPQLMVNHPELRTCDVLQQAFQEIYYLYDVGNPKQAQVPRPLEQLAQIYGTIEGTPASALELSLSNFINYYAVLTLNHEVCTRLVHQTISYYQDLLYWEAVQLSRWRTLWYGLQIAPVKLYQMALDILNQVLVRQEFDALAQDRPLADQFGQAQHLVRVFVGKAVEVVTQLVSDANPIVLFKKDSLTTHDWLKDRVVSLYKFPLTLVRGEIRSRVEHIHAELDAKYAALGRLIESLPTAEPQVSDFTDTVQTFNVAELVKVAGTSGSTTSEQLAALVQWAQTPAAVTSTRPAWLVRYWPVVALALRVGPGLTHTAITEREQILAWLKHNVIDTFVGFWANWVIAPVNNMLGILRSDELAELSITTKESLQSDLDSLERMVVDYVVDYEATARTPELVRQIHTSVASGDLTALMANYEKDLKNPVRLALRGLLVRALLIQIQKTKVDGAVAISGIDRLLKSQQLVFGVVSILPSLFVLYQAYQYLVNREDTASVNSYKYACVKALTTIEQVVGAPHSPAAEGRLLVEVINLIIQSRKVIPPALRKNWIAELNGISDSSSPHHREAAVARLWRVYGRYF